MIHQIETTEGIILAKHDYREANQAVVLYTERFGKVTASAQGVRLGRGKLRTRLGLFARGRFSLVFGRRAVRLVDVEEIAPGMILLDEPARLIVFANVAALMLRLLQGEERQPAVWHKLSGLLQHLMEKTCDRKTLRLLELKTLFHLLREMGYLAAGPKTRFTEATLAAAVNDALIASQL